MKSNPDPINEISTRLGAIETRLSRIESRIEALLIIASATALPTHLSIGEAAKMSGVTRWAIQKKLRNGQLTGETNPVTGQITIMVLPPWDQRPSEFSRCQIFYAGWKKREDSGWRGRIFYEA
jgi:hypothetical protein